MNIANNNKVCYNHNSNNQTPTDKDTQQVNTPTSGKNYLNGKLIEDPTEYLFAPPEELPVEATEIYPEDLVDTPFVQEVLKANEARKAFLERMVDSWFEEAKSNNTESEQ